MSSVQDLQTVFGELDLRVKNSLADESSPLRLALAGLLLAHDDANHEYVSLDTLRQALEAAGVSVKRSSLASAISRAGNRVSRRVVDGEARYRLMIRGRREAEEVLGTGDLEILYVEGYKPRTARLELAEILADLRGTVRISDPYYGVRSLESLELIPEKCTVRFLTGRTNEGAARLTGPMKDFNRERPNIEMRVAAQPQDLHDRYVLSDKKLLLVGHGFKDIGSKESFVMVIPRTLAANLLADVQRSFDQRWATATPL